MMEVSTHKHPGTVMDPLDRHLRGQEQVANADLFLFSPIR